ncbi:hypothetical protein Pint_28312 [Pistacia integerrima]|uniref:Uncharacterized protein n=1 Tax=Pistacia integerrima TaxID=434235 RepID=A0ACC0YUW2_9ROSI|nr:hypothetical protein Pint_28312 [Pistacia integerrima]
MSVEIRNRHVGYKRATDMSVRNDQPTCRLEKRNRHVGQFVKTTDMSVDSFDRHVGFSEKNWGLYDILQT